MATYLVDLLTFLMRAYMQVVIIVLRPTKNMEIKISWSSL